jgi:hypothetical protein
MSTTTQQKPFPYKILLGFNLFFLLVWVNAKFFGYDYILTGALFELLWLPSLLMLFVSTAISLIYWIKQKFALNSVYFYLVIFSAVLLGLLFGLSKIILGFS